MVNKEKLIFSENKLIYGFFYFIDKDSFNEENKLNYLIDKFSKKIPLKIMITKFKSQKQKKRLKNKIEMEMNLTPYFLGYNEDDPNHINEMNNNLRNMINGFIKELDEKKLKDIYKFYYILNILDIFLKKIKTTLEKFDALLKLLPTEDNNYEKYIKSRITSDIAILFPNQKLYIGNILDKFNNIYNEFIKQIKIDLDGGHYNYDKDLFLNDEDRTFWKNLKFSIVENKLPLTVSFTIYYKIQFLLLDSFMNKLKKLILIDDYNSFIDKIIKKYPDYTKIRNDILNNFVFSHKYEKNDEL